MKKIIIVILCLSFTTTCYCWGFFGHRLINQYAVFLLPPEMVSFYKPHLGYLYEHAVDPDKRRYAVPGEGPKHYIDIDVYGSYPFSELPRKYEEAVAKFGIDSIMEYGVVPWAIQDTYQKLVFAFKNQNAALILKYSSDLGHYIADSHVPLHASNNHNGQLTGQKGIHAFWESRIPELLAEKQFDFFIGKAEYINDIEGFTWDRILESALEADSVLTLEKQLSRKYGDNKYAFEERNGQFIRQYSSAYTIEYNQLLGNMVERKMRLSIYSVASYWYTAWVMAGQPKLNHLKSQPPSESELSRFEALNNAWKSGKILGREHDD